MMDTEELMQHAQSQLASNDILGANETLAKLSELLPKNVHVLMQFAWTSLQIGNLQKATSLYQNILKYNPNLTRAHFFLAMAFGQSGHTQKSRLHFSHVLKNEPNNIDALVKIAYLDYLAGDTISTMSFLMKAKNIQPEHVELNIRFGRLYTAMDEFEKAIRHYGIALKVDQENVEAIGQLASLYSFSGDTEKALNLLQPYLKKSPVERSIAIVLADICRSIKKCDEAKHYLEEILKDHVDPITKGSILFALGTIYDRDEEYNNAFKCYDEANKLNDFKYDEWEERQITSEITEKLNTDFFKLLPKAKNISKKLKPVFIVGMPRSGTSLVEQILSSHPHVHGAGERMEIPAIAMTLQKNLDSRYVYPFCLININSSFASTKAKKYLKDISKKMPSGMKIITDKMPDNYKHLPLIQQLFPKAKIIHCVRDPRDNCLSCYFTQLMGNAFSYDLKSLGVHYRLYEAIMSHWKRVLKLPILEVKYEDMVSDTEKVSREIIEFCGLDWSEECLNFHETKRNVVTASSDQVRQPIYTKSVARWKNYESQIGELLKALSKRI